MLSHQLPRWSLITKPSQAQKNMSHYGFFGVEVWGDKGLAAFLAQSTLLSETCQDHRSRSGW